MAAKSPARYDLTPPASDVAGGYANRTWHLPPQTPPRSPPWHQQSQRYQRFARQRIKRHAFELRRRLETVEAQEALRTTWYGAKADEWRMRHTPTEKRDALCAEAKMQLRCAYGWDWDSETDSETETESTPKTPLPRQNLDNNGPAAFPTPPEDSQPKQEQVEMNARKRKPGDGMLDFQAQAFDQGPPPGAFPAPCTISRPQRHLKLSLTRWQICLLCWIGMT